MTLPPLRAGQPASPDLLTRRARMPAAWTPDMLEPGISARDTVIGGVACLVCDPGDATFLYFHGGGYRMGSPAAYVLDCSNAGAVLPLFAGGGGGGNEAAAAAFIRDAADGAPPPRGRDYLLLAACSAGETLPVSGVLPADAFTACLTTPLKMALRAFLARRDCTLPPVFFEHVDRVAGRAADRKTPLGELNWVFTSVTDTIAWTTLPRPLFLRLFRSDLLTAALFRNFLFADRVMRTHGCTPCSHPPLPPTHAHPLWDALDAALAALVAQLPALFGFTPYDVRAMAALAWLV